MPKFHDRASLICGIMAGITLMGTGGIVVYSENWIIGWFQVAVGLVLAVHCFDMIRYYKRHRIVKIFKACTERRVYKRGR